jgi:hypothetical protein
MTMVRIVENLARWPSTFCAVDIAGNPGHIYARRHVGLHQMPTLYADHFDRHGNRPADRVNHLGVPVRDYFPEYVPNTSVPPNSLTLPFFKPILLRAIKSLPLDETENRFTRSGFLATFCMNHIGAALCNITV